MKLLGRIEKRIFILGILLGSSYDLGLVFQSEMTLLSLC